MLLCLTKITSIATCSVVKLVRVMHPGNCLYSFLYSSYVSDSHILLDGIFSVWGSNEVTVMTGSVTKIRGNLCHQLLGHMMLLIAVIIYSDPHGSFKSKDQPSRVSNHSP